MTAAKARLLIIGLALLILPISFVSLVAPPANAATSCSITNQPGSTWRNCHWDTSRAGARSSSGSAYWNFTAQNGNWYAQIKDTAPDGQCAYLKYVGPDFVLWLPACGNNVQKTYAFDLNTDQKVYYSGVFSVWVCTGQSSCTILWSQRIEAPAP